MFRLSSTAKFGYFLESLSYYGVVSDESSGFSFKTVDTYPGIGVA